MLAKIKKIVKPIVSRIFRIRSLSVLPRLRGTGHPSASAVADAIEQAVKNDFSREEQSWIDRIENMRREMNRSTQQIDVIDFGAGTPDDSRDEKEMYSGSVHRTTIGETCRIASKPFFWSVLLFSLVRKLKPRRSVELGTCLGVSGSYQAAAKKMNGDGILITMEGAAPLAEQSALNFRSLGLDNAEVVHGRFNDKLPEILNRGDKIDLAFIDGHHDRDATLEYFNNFLPHLNMPAVMIFDDISWSAGMREAWRKIVDHDYVKVAIDFRAVGLCIVDSTDMKKADFEIPLF